MSDDYAAAKQTWQECHRLAAKLEQKAAEMREAGMEIDAADLERRASYAVRFGNLWQGFMERCKSGE